MKTWNPKRSLLSPPILLLDFASWKLGVPWQISSNFPSLLPQLVLSVYTLRCFIILLPGSLINDDKQLATIWVFIFLYVKYLFSLTTFKSLYLISSVWPWNAHSCVCVYMQTHTHTYFILLDFANLDFCFHVFHPFLESPWLLCLQTFFLLRFSSLFPGIPVTYFRLPDTVLQISDISLKLLLSLWFGYFLFSYIQVHCCFFFLLWCPVC